MCSLACVLAAGTVVGLTMLELSAGTSEIHKMFDWLSITINSIFSQVKY